MCFILLFLRLKLRKPVLFCAQILPAVVLSLVFPEKVRYITIELLTYLRISDFTLYIFYLGECRNEYYDISQKLRPTKKSYRQRYVFI